MFWLKSLCDDMYVVLIWACLDLVCVSACVLARVCGLLNAGESNMRRIGRSGCVCARLSVCVTLVDCASLFSL